MNRAVTSYPASGGRNTTSGEFYNTGSNTYCWNCALIGVYAYYWYYNPTSVAPTNYANRACGFAVRCVQHLLLSL
jgi:hypothetical protein